MPLKKAMSTGGLSAGLDLAYDGDLPASSVGLGWAQQVNLEALRTAPGPVSYRPPDSPRAAQVKRDYPALLPALEEILQTKISARFCNEGVARLMVSCLFCCLSLLTIYALPGWFILLSWCARARIAPPASAACQHSRPAPPPRAAAR